MTLNDLLIYYSFIVSTLVLICGGWVAIRNWFQKKVAVAAAEKAATSSASTSATTTTTAS